MRPKRVHRARLLRNDGAVSALCFKLPQRVNLKRANWTICDELVTCRKCLKLISEREAKAA